MKTFTEDMARLGVHLTERQQEQFERYVELLLEWSARANLVGDASEDVVRRRHFFESIALGAALREREVLRPRSEVVDIGAGAGFPGVPIKIVWPEIRLTLLEATAKKTAFLAALVAALGLEGVQVVTARAEDAGHDRDLRARFDLVLARAVASVRTLVELALPFARVGGRVVAPKGSHADAEVADAHGALAALHSKAFVVPFEVPGPAQKLVVLVKDAETPEEYPRRSGMPKKHPL